MALKSALNAEMKRLKTDAKSLEKKRSSLTAEIDKQIAENSQKQSMLQEFMDATFGVKKKAAAKQAAPSKGKRRKRKNRKDVRPRVLAAINASAGGIKRNAILEALNMASDTAGHQYVSNTLSALFKEGKIAKQGRVYYPVTASSAPAAPSSDPAPASSGGAESSSPASSSPSFGSSTPGSSESDSGGGSSL